MSKKTKRDEDNIATDSISETTEEQYKYCTRCGAKNYAEVKVCFNCERCSDFVDTFDEYEKLKQSETAAALQAMLAAERRKTELETAATVQALLAVERQKMEAEIRARLEKENAAKPVQTKEKMQSVAMINKKAIGKTSQSVNGRTKVIETVYGETVVDWTKKGDSCYNTGNYKEAVEWYRKAAEQGYAKAQSDLGYCYYSGRGVKQDYKEAVNWYRKAAEQGYARAQNNLGVCYTNGYGVEKSYFVAIEWYRKAAEQGYAKAQNNLGDCYANGYGIKQDYVEAARLYKCSAKQGFVKAQNNLGDCYYYGRGVKQFYKEAVKWYKRAVAQGDEYAKVSLAELNRKGFY